MDAFAQMIERVLSHEGGYVNDPRIALKYMNESKIQSHSRIARSNVIRAGVGYIFSCAIRCCNLYSSKKFSGIWLFRCWMRATCLCQRALQCALHKDEKRQPYGCSGSSEKTGRHLHGVRQIDWSKGWLGSMPTSLPASAVRDDKGCCNKGLWVYMRTLSQQLSSLSFRLSSPWRQGRLSERNANKQFAQCVGQRAFEMHIAMRQLPPAGALR